MTLTSTLVLASASPRRAELLTAAGYRFVVRAADVDESLRPGEAPAEAVRRLARDKALAVTAGLDELVLAADTLVTIDGEALGKPDNAAAARTMLARLSGRAHDVVTGVACRRGDAVVTDVVRTTVWMATLDDATLTWYVASGEPLDKAGAYGIQGLASRFVTRIDGSYSNVVGLPVATVAALLRAQAGIC